MHQATTTPNSKIVYKDDPTRTYMPNDPPYQNDTKFLLTDLAESISKLMNKINAHQTLGDKAELITEY